MLGDAGKGVSENAGARERKSTTIARGFRDTDLFFPDRRSLHPWSRTSDYTRSKTIVAFYQNSHKVVGLTPWVPQDHGLQNHPIAWRVCHVIGGWMKHGGDEIHDPRIWNTVTCFRVRQTISLHDFLM